MPNAEVRHPPTNPAPIAMIFLGGGGGVGVGAESSKDNDGCLTTTPIDSCGVDCRLTLQGVFEADVIEVDEL